MKLAMCCLLGLMSVPAHVWADVVTLKNGDRVTGTLVTVKGGNLDFKSDSAGELTIPLAQITSFVGVKPVAVVEKGKEPLRGTLELKSGGQWQVTVKGEAKTFDAAKVDVIMPEDDYQKLMVETPKLWQAWHGTAGLGYSLQHGDQSTTTLTTNVNAVHERPATPIFQAHWRTAFDFTTLLSHASESGTTATITSRTLTTSLRPEYLFTERNFVFAFGELDHVSTQHLYLRQTYGGGFGHDLVKSERLTFAVLGGPTYAHQKFFDGTSDDSAEAMVGETLGVEINKRARVEHSLTFYPNLSQTGEYHFDTSTVLSCKLSTRLSLNASFIDLYLSDPPPGSHNNDVTVSLGIGYSF